MTTSVVGTPFHQYVATSGTGYSTSIACSVNDVIVVKASDAGNRTITAACSGATATLAAQKTQVSNNAATTLTILTGVVTGAGTATIAVTSAGGDVGFTVEVYRGLSSATASASVGVAPSGDTAIISGTLDTTGLGTCTFVIGWANEGSDSFTSWLGSPTIAAVNHDTVHYDANGYSLDVTAGSYTVGANTNSSGGVSSCIVAIALPVATASGPTINTQPTDQTVYPGDTATFNIAATTSGGTLHYQWKFDGSNVGTDANSYARSSVVAADNGKAVYCNVSDDNGNIDSTTVHLYVIAPTISVQPTDQTRDGSGTITFNTTVAGASSYQWQSQAPTGGSWSNAGGSDTSDDYTTGSLTRASDSGRLFRLKATNTVGDTYSTIVSATITAIPTSYSGIGLIVGAADSFVGEAMVGGPVSVGATSHATTGTLTGAGSTLSGVSAHKAKHTTIGALVGAGSTVAGTARRFRTHAASGVLTGAGSTLAGTSAHKAKHTTTGALTGAGSSVIGSAHRYRSHPTTGDLTGAGSSVIGSAHRYRTMATSGALIGQGGVITGDADRSGSQVTHATFGTLVGQGSTLAGTASYSTFVDYIVRARRHNRR